MRPSWNVTAVTAAGDESETVAALRRGDNRAFTAVIDTHYSTTLRVARLHVSSHEAAEDIVQDTLLAVIRGIDDFEQRASLRTWTFHILVNRAKSVGAREHRTRTLPFPDHSVLPRPALGKQASVAERRRAGFSQRPPPDNRLPESGVLTAEMCEVIRVALDAMTPGQRAVISLCDLEGIDPDRVCELLGLTKNNQRVQLHRARTILRSSLESYLDDPTQENPEPSPC